MVTVRMVTSPGCVRTGRNRPAGLRGATGLARSLWNRPKLVQAGGLSRGACFPGRRPSSSRTPYFARKRCSPPRNAAD